MSVTARLQHSIWNEPVTSKVDNNCLLGVGQLTVGKLVLQLRTVGQRLVIRKHTANRLCHLNFGIETFIPFSNGQVALLGISHCTILLPHSSNWILILSLLRHHTLYELVEIQWLVGYTHLCPSFHLLHFVLE